MSGRILHASGARAERAGRVEVVAPRVARQSPTRWCPLKDSNLRPAD